MAETTGEEIWRLRSYRNIWVVLVVLVVVTAVIVVAALLIERSNRSEPDFNGYWQSAPDGLVIRLEGSNGSYRMTGMDVDAATLTASGESANSIQGQVAYQGGSITVKLSLNGEGEQLILAMRPSTATASQGMTAVTLTRVPGSLEEVDAKMQARLDKAKESAVKEAIHGLQVGVQSWAVDHGDRYPMPSQVTRDGAVGRTYMDRWPTNPYTGEPMEQGAAPGDFTYERLEGGAGFMLTGHFEGEGSFTVP